MIDTTTKRSPIVDLADPDIDLGSDNESFDSDGYNKLDPYREAAKIADKKLAVKAEFEGDVRTRLSTKILENKDNITWFEKRAKTFIALGVLLVMSIQGYRQFGDTPGYFKADEFSLVIVMKEMSPELAMLFGSLTLLFLARWYNDYLDRQEALLNSDSEEEETSVIENHKTK